MRFETKSAAILVVILLTLGACTSTQKRINDNITFFQSLSTKHQILIQHSIIDIGFTPQEVYLAWGPPDHHVISRGTRGPAKETWYYTVVRPEPGPPAVVREYDPATRSWNAQPGLLSVYREFTVKDIVFKRGLVDTWTVYSEQIPYPHHTTSSR